MMTPEAEPPLPLRPYLGTELDPYLVEAVSPEDSALIDAIQRASRYANVSSSGKVTYSRRVLMLGIAETVLSGRWSSPVTAAIAEWVVSLDPELGTSLQKLDQSDAVRRALASNPEVRVHAQLRELLGRARGIARHTGGRDRIELRHLMFALTETPGRAFHDFGRAPKPEELSRLRVILVQTAEAGEAAVEDMNEWQRLLRDANVKPAPPEPQLETGELERPRSKAEPKAKNKRAAQSAASKPVETAVQSPDSGPEKPAPESRTGRGDETPLVPAARKRKARRKPAPTSYLTMPSSSTTGSSGRSSPLGSLGACMPFGVAQTTTTMGYAIRTLPTKARAAHSSFISTHRGAGERRPLPIS